MTSWSESIKLPVFPENNDMLSVGTHVPVSIKGGRLPYCIYNKPGVNDDGTIRIGLRCGVERYLCADCGKAGGECFTRKQGYRGR